MRGFDRGSSGSRDRSRERARSRKKRASSRDRSSSRELSGFPERFPQRDARPHAKLSPREREASNESNRAAPAESESRDERIRARALAWEQARRRQQPAASNHTGPERLSPRSNLRDVTCTAMHAGQQGTKVRLVWGKERYPDQDTLRKELERLSPWVAVPAPANQGKPRCAQIQVCADEATLMQGLAALDPEPAVEAHKRGKGIQGGAKRQR